MKKFNKPGFEFIFSIALIVILGLPALVLAQSQKNIEIQITNGDTTINGKNIKKLTAVERKDALEAMNDLPPVPPTPGVRGGSNSKVIIKKRISSNGEPQIVDVDSSHKEVKIRLRKLKGADSVQAFSYRFDNNLPPMEMKTFSFDMPRGGAHRFELSGRNSQVFNYSNTDEDGISTNVSFRVSEASKDKLKALGAEKANLTMNDLNLSFEFSTGKTVLAFNLPTKTVADVKLTDTKGTAIWADKIANGSFSKKFSLPLNGVYYLQVKQGANVAVKKIVKE